MPSSLRFDSTSTPSAILLHRCESGTTGPEVRAAEALASNGYHYFIRRCGMVDQLYSWGEPVWHALHWSYSTLAVAVHGDFDPREGSRYSRPTDPQIHAATQLCSNLFDRWHPMPVLGHTDLPGATAYPDKRCPGVNLDVRAIEREALVLWAS